MERLIVKNFLSITEADMEVGRFTVIIGPQASGKSVLAKLVYLFREFCFNGFLTHATDLDDERSFREIIQDELEAVFPRGTWLRQTFRIEYHSGEVYIRLVYEPTGEHAGELRVGLPQHLVRLYRETRKQYAKEVLQEELVESAEIDALDQLRAWNVKVGGAFIPASRSFFAYLQRSTFSSLDEGLILDLFFRKFGAAYERAKRRYEKEILPRQQPHRALLEAVVEEASAIWMGRYQRIRGKDWIKTDERLTPLLNASSGQQEALPMLLVLSSRLRIGGREDFIVEEPEAHLFPNAQKRLVNILSMLHSVGNDFLITTHSPYILSALNVLIQADDLIRDKPKTVAKVKKLLGNGRPVAYDDVRVYALNDGKLVLEMNRENRLIGENVLDEVSTEFEHVFNELLMIQYPPDEAE